MLRAMLANTTSPTMATKSMPPATGATIRLVQESRSESSRGLGVWRTAVA